jgi:hypothetical protein
MSFKRLVNIGNLLLLFSLVPLAFLVYTLMNLDVLGITLTHPRVIVELSIFLVLLIAGLYGRVKR